MFKTSIRYRFTLTLLVLAIAALSAVAHAQTFSVLYNFGTQSDDPTNPQYSGIVAQGRDGNLYSAAPGGTDGVGAMFKITPGGTLTVPYTFDLTVEPYGGLTLGTDGNFYGTTNSGGTANLGTVFKVAPGGKLTVLHEFTNTGDGAYPYAPPIEGADGNFYGTTTQANLANGTVYKITSSGVLTTLHTFDFAEGQYPFAPLVQGTDGNFYGTAQLGGRSTKCVGGCGTVFKITLSGALSVLYNFDELHGEVPLGPLMQGSDGNFYGTTTGGGTYGPHCCGVIFKITPAGALTVLHDFPASLDDGINVMAGLVQATDGNLYGTTAGGGANAAGIDLQHQPEVPIYLQNPLCVRRHHGFESTGDHGPTHEWHFVRRHASRRNRHQILRRLWHVLQPEHGAETVRALGVHLRQGWEFRGDPGARVHRDDPRLVRRNRCNLHGIFRHLPDGKSPSRGTYRLGHRNHSRRKAHKQSELSRYAPDYQFHSGQRPGGDLC